MIKIRIGDSEREIKDADPSWVTQQVNRRRRNGVPVCVRIEIDEPPLKLRLSTPECGPSRGGRPPRPGERRILDLWNKHKLNTDEFTGGNLQAFIAQLRNLL